MARTLTAANSVITLSLPDLFSIPQQLSGFSADDVVSTDQVTMAETAAGIDGKLSGGYVYNPVVQTFVLQADSTSIDIMETIVAAMRTAQETYIFNGSILLPATGKSYSLTRGFLTSTSIVPGVKKILQPQSFTITWQSVTPALT
jgi:hypothetical protein